MYQDPWLRAAYSKLGVKEIPGDEHHPGILEFHAATTLKATTDEVPWCSSFACWAMEAAKIESPRDARARYWLLWGVRLLHPPHGAVCILQRGGGGQPGESVLDAPGHVGFYVGPASDESILLLGGNQGNQVQVSAYPRSRILGFRWPR